MKRFTFIILALFLAMAFSTNTGKAFALEKPKGYPKRAIEVVVPHGPGSGADMFARAFCKDVEKTLGVLFKFNFMPGSAGAIGTTYAMDQPADGYTIFMVSLDIAINMALKRFKFDVDDFT